jgi:transposase-like protein
MRISKDWIDEHEPGRRRKRSPARSLTDEQKRDAVVELESREKPATQIAADLGVERATLYGWKKRMLRRETPYKIEKDRTDLPDDPDELRLVSSSSRTSSEGSS